MIVLDLALATIAVDDAVDVNALISSDVFIDGSGEWVGSKKYYSDDVRFC